MRKDIEIICPYCNIRLNSGGVGGHLRAHKTGETKEEKFYKVMMFNNKEFEKVCSSKEQFEDLYSKHSIPSFNREWPGVNLLFLCDWYGVKRRTPSESAKLLAQPKIKKYCLEKYGTTNILGKGTPFYEKRNKTVKEKYGVDNIFQIKEVKEWINSDELFLQKYNMTRYEFHSKIHREAIERMTDEERNNWLDKSIRSEKCIQTKRNRGIWSSDLERKIADICIKIGFNIETSVYFKIKNKRYFFDILIKECNCIIEVQGDYWHFNPKFYKETDIITRFGKELIVKDIWKKDYDRSLVIKSLGYRYLELWEYDINQNHNEESLILFIKEKLNEVCQN